MINIPLSKIKDIFRMSSLEILENKPTAVSKTKIKVISWKSTEVIKK